MHLSEFKAWFDGFTEEMKGPPTKDQWAKIRKRVKEISADYTPAPVFVERYYRPWRRYWDNEPYWVSNTNGANASNGALLSGNISQTALSADDWHSAGKAEYSAGLR